MKRTIECLSEQMVSSVSLKKSKIILITRVDNLSNTYLFMKKTQKLIGVALCAFAFGSIAKAQKQMVVTLADSEQPWKCALSQLGSATFLNSQINFGGTEEGTTLKTFDLKNITSITFESITDGINAVTADKVGNFKATVVGQSLHVTGVGEPSTLTIFTTTGQIVKQQPTWSGADINISALTPGVYVVKVGNKVAKFSK